MKRVECVLLIAVLLFVGGLMVAGCGDNDEPKIPEIDKMPSTKDLPDLEEGMSDMKEDLEEGVSGMKEEAEEGYADVKEKVSGLKMPTLSKAQTTCPVMGEKIDKKYYVDYKGQRVYFCREDCIEMFKKEPEKYMAKLAEMGVDLEKLPDLPKVPELPKLP